MAFYLSSTAVYEVLVSGPVTCRGEMGTTQIAVNQDDSIPIDEEDWPKGVPRTYTELYNDYGAFVASALRRHNKVSKNFDELLCHIWKRLIEKDILTLFLESVNDKLPRHLNTRQVCAYLGVTVKQWAVQMHKYHQGTPIRVKTAFDSNFIVCRVQGTWMPTPVNWDDIQEEAKGRAERRAQGKPLGRKTRRLEPVYLLTDIMELASDEFRGKDGFIRYVAFPNQIPKPSEAVEGLHIKPTKAHFISYLSKSIYSDFLNWCRTYRRKWSQDQPMTFRDDNDTDCEWEHNLEDPRGAQQETKVIVHQATTRISEILHRGMQRETSLDQPVQQTEMQLRELLEQGVPLPDALQRLKVPERVRRAVLRSIEDFRVNAA